MPRATNWQEKNEPAKVSEEKLWRAGAHLSLRGPRIQRRTRGDEERLARMGDMRTREERRDGDADRQDGEGGKRGQGRRAQGRL